MANIAVVGDVMLDVELYGLPRDNQEQAEICLIGDHPLYYPGGAANVAKILSRMGHTVNLFSIVGPDWEAEELTRVLGTVQPHFSYQLVTTTTKMRVYNFGQVSVRIDWEQYPTHLLGSITWPVRTLCNQPHSDYNAIVFCDYNKGVFNLACRHNIQKVIDWGIPVIVAPKPTDYISMWEGCHTVVLNGKEAGEAGVTGETDYKVITKGEEGAQLTYQGSTYFKEAPQVHNPQIVGAGDAVTAGVTDAIFQKLSAEETLEYALEVATKYVSKPRRQYWEG